MKSIRFHAARVVFIISSYQYGNSAYICSRTKVFLQKDQMNVDSVSLDGCTLFIHS